VNGDDPKPKRKPVKVEELLGPDEAKPPEGARKPYRVEELLGDQPEPVRPAAATPAPRQPTVSAGTRPGIGIADLLREGYKRLTDPEEYDPTEGVRGLEGSEFRAITRPGAAPRQPVRPGPSRLAPPKFDATGLPVYDPEATADVARAQETPEVKAPADAVNYRDPKAVAEYTAHWMKIANGSVHKPDGTEYTKQEREYAHSLAQNLSLRMGLEDVKGGFGTKYLNRLTSYVPPGLTFLSGGVSGEAYRKIREAQDTGDLPTQTDIEKFGKPRTGTSLRAEPTFGEGMLEEAPAAIAGDITAMVLGGSGRLIAGAGEVAEEVGTNRLAESLRLAARGEAPTATTAMGRAGQRLVSGGLPGAGAGAVGDYAETRSRGGTPTEALTAAGLNAALGFGLGAATQIVAGAAWDFAGPSVKRLAARLASSMPAPFENHNANIYEAILREKEAAEATGIVNRERAAAGQLPLDDKNPEAHLRAISDALEQVLAQKQEVRQREMGSKAAYWAEQERRTGPRDESDLWTPEQREAYRQTPEGAAAAEAFERGRTEPFPFQRPAEERGIPWKRPTDQADMSKNMERLMAERQAAELQAVEQARVEAEQAKSQPVQEPVKLKSEHLSTVDTRGKKLSEMSDDELARARSRVMAKRDALRERADAARPMGEAEPHEIDRESVNTMLKNVERDLRRLDDAEAARKPVEAPPAPSVGEEAGRQAMPAALALGAEESDNDDTKKALAAAAALSTGKEGTALHEGERYFSRLSRFLESKPWKGAMPVTDILNRLKSGPFSQEELKVTLLPELEAIQKSPLGEKTKKLTHEEVMQVMNRRQMELGDTRLTETGRHIIPGEAPPPPEPRAGYTGAGRADPRHDPIGPFPDDYESEVARVREERETAISDAQEQVAQAERDLSEAHSDVETEFQNAGGGRLGDLHSALERGTSEEGYVDVDKVLNRLLEDGAFDNLYSPSLDTITPDGYSVRRGQGDDWHVVKDGRAVKTVETEYEAMAEVDRLSRHPVPSIGNLRELLDDVTVKYDDNEGDYILLDRDGDEIARNPDRESLLQEYVNDNYERDDNALDDLRSALETYNSRNQEYYSTESETYMLREEDASYDENFMEELEAAREADQEAMDEHLAEAGPDTPARDPRDPEQMTMVLRGTSADGVPSTADLAREAVLPMKAKGKSKFHTYQRVPNGRNYREVLISWDNRMRGEEFTAGHFPDLVNTLAHLRMTEHDYSPPTTEAIKAYAAAVERRNVLGQQQGEVAQRYHALIPQNRDGTATAEEIALANEYAAIQVEVQKAEAEFEATKREVMGKHPNAKVEKVLNAFEHQSDWKQRGEEHGFRNPGDEHRTVTDKETETIQAAIRELENTQDEFDIYRRNADARPSKKAAILKTVLEDTPWQAMQPGEIDRLVGRDMRAYRRLREKIMEANRKGARAASTEIDKLVEKLPNDAYEPVGDMPFKESNDVFNLTSARMLSEAAEGDYDRVAWSTAENREQLAHLTPDAAKITYDQSVTGAVKRLFKGLGIDVQIERIVMDGYSHWSVKLTPEMKAKIKKFGFPLLGALAATATSAETAKADDGTRDKPNPYIPIAPALLAAGVLVVRHAAVRKGAERAFEYFEAAGGKALKEFDARGGKAKVVTEADVGEAVARESLKDGVPYIRVPKEQIYDAEKDPHGIIAKLVKTGLVTPEAMADAIQRAGFVAYRTGEEGKAAIKLIGAPGDPPIPARLARNIEKFQSEGRGVLYSNPVGPALSMLKRSPTAVSLAVLGMAADNSDDKNIHRMSKPLIGLAALNAIGSKNLMKGGEAVVKTLVDQLSRTEAGRTGVRFISPALLLPEEINEGLAIRRSDLAKGRARAKEFGEMARTLGGKGDREVSDVLEGEDWEGLTGPTVAGVMSVAQAHEAEYARLTAEQLRSGVLKPEQVIEGYAGPRKYAEYEALDVWKNDESGGKAVPGGSRRVQEVKRRTLDIPIREAQDKLDEAMAGGDPQAISDAMDALDEAQVQQLGARLDRGEIRESSYRIENHIAKASQNIANADFLHVASTTPGMVHPDFQTKLDEFLDARQNWKAATNPQDRAVWQSLMDDAKAEMDDVSRRYQTKDAKWATLPDTPGLGVLRGMVVDKALHRELVGMPESFGIDKVINFWKQTHTVFNLGTNVANVIANIPILHLAGVPLWEQPIYLTKAVKDINKYGEAARALTEAGVFNLNFATATAEGESVLTGKEGALKALHKTTRPETAAVLDRRSAGLVGKTGSLEEIAAAINKPLDWVRKVYNNEDNVFRAALFLKRRAEGASIEEAVKAARSEFGNFYTRSPALSVARRLSPFILWPLKVLPPVAKNVIDHPYRYLTLVAAGAALDEYSKSQVGEIPEEDIEERDRRKWGYFFPGFTQLPFVDAEGRKAALDLGRFTPFSSATDVANQGSTGAAISDRFPRVLTPSGPAAELWNIASNNYDSFRGEPRYSDTSGPWGVAGEIAKDLGRAAAPPSVGFHLPRILNDLANSDRSKASIDALGLVGARPRFVEPGGVAFRAQLEYEKDMQRLNRELKRALNASRNPARDEELFKDYDAKVDRAAAKFERTVSPPPR